MNDIVVLFNSLKEHLRHLIQNFVLFKKYNIVIKTFKIYFDYFSIILLNQRINNFDLFIVENKLKVIRELKFSHIFKYLKTYFDKIDYLRQYVIYYAQKTIFYKNEKLTCFVKFLTKNVFVNNISYAFR